MRARRLQKSDKMIQATAPNPIRRSVTMELPSEMAERIAAGLEDIDPAPDAVGYFETGPRRSELFAHYTGEPNVKAIEAMLGAVNDGAAVGPIRVEAIADADWVTISQGKRGKVRAGRFTVHGSHESVPAARGAIEIDASVAFGTAHHASTRGCLLALDEILKRYRPARVLDIGTGSGVLAIAAAKFARAAIIATDNDAAALRVASQNARLNGVPHIRFALCDGFDDPALNRVSADLVFGNLLKSLLVALAQDFTRHVAAGGLAVLSGITADQASRVEACYRAHGFVLRKRLLLDGWAILVLEKRPAIPSRRLIAAHQRLT